MKRLACGLVLAAMMALGGGQPAMAAEARIVARGASNTHGMGVAPSQAYPAHLEQMLRAGGL